MTVGHRDLEGLLSRAAAARRGFSVTLAALSGAAAVALAWVAALTLDALLGLPGLVRAALLVALVPGGLAWLVWRIGAAARARPSRAEAARLLETRLSLEGNPLIDAVLLGDEADAGRPGLSPELAGRVLDEAQRVSARVDEACVREGRRLRRPAWALAGAAAFLGIAFLVLPGVSARTMGRFLRPFETAAAAPTGCSLEVSPGDVRVVAGAGFDVRATATARDAAFLPEDADVECAGLSDARTRVPMTARRGAVATTRRFEARVEAGEAAFRYRVVAAGATSPWYRADVASKPDVAEATARVTPPAYTGRPASDVSLASAPIAALVGAEVALSLRTTRPCKEGRLLLPAADPVPLAKDASGRMTATFVLTKSGPLAARLVGEDGVENEDARLGVLTAVDDALPTVRLEPKAPSLVVVPGESVEMPIRAEDDVGLKGLRLLGGIDGDAREVELWKTAFPAPGPDAARERPVITFDPAGYEPGRTYRFVAEAEDHGPTRPGRARSAAVLVRVRGPQDLAVAPGSPLGKAFERLRALAEAVRAERNRLATLVDLYDEHVREGRLAKRTAESLGGHQALGPRMKEVADAFRAEPTGARAAQVVEALAADDLATVLREIAGAGRRGKAKEGLARAVAADDLLLAKILALLGDLAAAAPTLPDRQDLGDKAPKSPADRLAQLAKELARFVAEQKKILETTKEVEKRAGEDLTKGDEELLGKLAAQESAWAKLFEEAFTDLSKVPVQDFADSKLLDELNQVYMEVQKASEALAGRKVELAVPAEQSGLELAESMETNIERWLPDTRDHEKWVMEEPPQEYDVPLADLPSELEDIVGDLLDSEESMDEAVEDVSSSWMDSLDAGVGWDATDGPISNMSARGVTGNRLPNQNEVGGRSGEGRSGRSHGQMVEKTAEGKGGRDTPTRRTDDPYEAGSVKDSSKDPRGGATGGGKVAGQGDTGLRGTPPPPVQAKLERLKGTQGELRQRAERLQRWLRALHLPSSDVDTAVAVMKRIEDRLAAGQGFDLRQAHADVREALEAARRSLHAESDTLRSGEAPMAPEIEREVFSGMREPVPPGLSEVVRAFYEAVSRGGRQGTGR